MLRYIFAGAILSAGALATIASGDITVGASTAFAAAAGSVGGGTAGLLTGLGAMFALQKEPDNYIFYTAALGAALGGTVAGIAGYDSASSKQATIDSLDQNEHYVIELKEAPLPKLPLGLNV